MPLVIALKEEIGAPELFVGRHEELTFFDDWLDRVKKEIGKSTALLARRRKGKTALVQRFFNIIYTRNDPKLIPFYIRIPERRHSLIEFAELFYRTMMNHYLGFKTRNVELIRKPKSLKELLLIARDDAVISHDIQMMLDEIERGNADLVWDHAHQAGHRISSVKDERIIQFLDEFQFLDKYIYKQDDSKEPLPLCGSYHHAASSKVSPQIITGSYVGWLSGIIFKMVGRYRPLWLEGLTETEAQAAVYAYAAYYNQEVTDESAVFMAEACNQDPFYIASLFDSMAPNKDLRTVEGVGAALDYETTRPKGAVAQLWFDYLWDVIQRVNDVHGKRLVLYLAHHAPEERTRKQILEDLDLDMTEQQLEDRLRKLVEADILAEGSNLESYKGLGDPLFDMVFRKAYEPGIARVPLESVRKDIARQLADLKAQLDSEKHRLSNYRGQAAEYRMRFILAMAGQKRLTLGQLTLGAAHPEIQLAPFETVRKHSFQPVQDHFIEVDIYAVAKGEGPNLVVEVKDWEGKVAKDRVTAFIETKRLLAKTLDANTLFLFYSETPMTQAALDRLKEAGILYADGTTFTW
ncbi:MAG: hypothetical protein QNK37_34480 [Acidobacteriota bacterium]|nr:hypothetical protein [Acidobacteriota bacterium]